MIDENVLPFKLELTNEKLAPHAGLVVAHEFHAGLGLDRLVDEMLPGPGSNRGYRPSEVVLPLVLMLQGGGRDLEDMAVIIEVARDGRVRLAVGRQAGGSSYLPGTLPPLSRPQNRRIKVEPVHWSSPIPGSPVPLPHRLPRGFRRGCHTVLLGVARS